jgi:hypothetical protein
MAGSRQAYPAIKILKQPLNRMTAEPAYDGMRIATVALYHGDARQAAWLDFSPEVINCVVQDPGEIQRVRGSISEEDWQLLDGWLAHVPTATPGLYRMWEMVQPDGTPVENYVASGTPWFKQKPAIIGLSIFGGFAALVFAFYLLGIFLNWHNQHRASRPSAYTPPPPSSHSFPAGAHPSMSELTQTGPFMIDSKIEANWAGGWVPGTITKINGGGHSVMVQLEDSRWPTSIVFSTNQIRLK